MARRNETRAAILPSGWLRVDSETTCDLYVRVAPDSSGRLRVRELYLDSDAPITGESLRALPIGEAEALANLNAEYVLYRMNEPGGDRLSVLASRLGAQFGRRSRQSWPERALEDWVLASWVAGLGQKWREERGLSAVQPPTKRPSPRTQRDRSVDYRLDSGPSGRELDEDFLRRLARAYAAAVARGERPNVTLAEDSGYPRRTVESWVYQARKRGYLPPARKGAAG